MENKVFWKVYNRQLLKVRSYNILYIGFAVLLALFSFYCLYNFHKNTLNVIFAIIAVLLSIVVSLFLKKIIEHPPTSTLTIAKEFHDLLKGFESVLDRRYPISVAALEKRDGFIGVINNKTGDTLYISENIISTGFLYSSAIIPIISHEFAHLKHEPKVNPHVRASILFSFGVFTLLTTFTFLFLDWRLALLLFALIEVRLFLKARHSQANEVLADLLAAHWTTPSRLARGLEIFYAVAIPDKVKVKELKKVRNFFMGSHPHLISRVKNIRSWEGMFPVLDVLPDWGTDAEALLKEETHDPAVANLIEKLKVLGNSSNFKS